MCPKASFVGKWGPRTRNQVEKSHTCSYNSSKFNNSSVSVNWCGGGGETVEAYVHVSQLEKFQSFMELCHAALSDPTKGVHAKSTGRCTSLEKATVMNGRTRRGNIYLQCSC